MYLEPLPVFGFYFAVVQRDTIKTGSPPREGAGAGERAGGLSVDRAVVEAQFRRR